MIMEKSLQLKKIYRENVIFMLLLCENVEKNIQKQKSQDFVPNFSISQEFFRKKDKSFMIHFQKKKSGMNPKRFYLNVLVFFMWRNVFQNKCLENVFFLFLQK